MTQLLDPLPESPQQSHRAPVKVQNRNPFRYLRPVPPEEFLGRWSTVKEMALDLTLNEGDSYACIGGRRFGKSSLLTALHYYLRQPEMRAGDCLVLPLFIDFKRSFASETAFFAHILHEVRRRVDVAIRHSPEVASPIKVSLDQAWFDDHLPVANPPGLSLTQLEEALNYILDQLYQLDGPTRLVLLLDEVDDILSYPWHRILFNQLRSLIYSGDMADNVRLVLSGSRRFLDEVSDRGSPLWNVLKLHYLATFDEATTYELSTRAENLPGSARQAVWRQSGGHPFLAQYLLHHLWREGCDQADDTTVARIANRFLHEEQAHLEGWANAVEEIGLRVYSHLINEPDWLDELELIRTINEEPNIIKRSLVALSYHGFIAHDGTWSRYRAGGDLLLQWFLSKYQNQWKKENKNMALPPEISVNAASFLFEIGRWAASELKERWKLARQKKEIGPSADEQTTEVDLSKPEEQAKQQVETLLQVLAIEYGVTEVERVLDLIKRKRDLIAEWREMKVDNEEEYNRQMVNRAALRLRQQELDGKISNTMRGIEADLKEIGLKVKKETTDQPAR